MKHHDFFKYFLWLSIPTICFIGVDSTRARVESEVPHGDSFYQKALRGLSFDKENADRQTADKDFAINIARDVKKESQISLEDKEASNATVIENFLHRKAEQEANEQNGENRAKNIEKEDEIEKSNIDHGDFDIDEASYALAKKRVIRGDLIRKGSSTGMSAARILNEFLLPQQDQGKVVWQQTQNDSDGFSSRRIFAMPQQDSNGLPFFWLPLPSLPKKEKKKEEAPAEEISKTPVRSPLRQALPYGVLIATGLAGGYMVTSGMADPAIQAVADFASPAFTSAIAMGTVAWNFLSGGSWAGLVNAARDIWNVTSAFALSSGQWAYNGAWQWGQSLFQWASGASAASSAASATVAAGTSAALTPLASLTNSAIANAPAVLQTAGIAGQRINPIVPLPMLQRCYKLLGLQATRAAANASRMSAIRAGTSAALTPLAFLTNSAIANAPAVLQSNSLAAINAGKDIAAANAMGWNAGVETALPAPTRSAILSVLTSVSVILSFLLSPKFSETTPA